MQTEMMSDSIDDALDNDEAEEETEELTNQVCKLITFYSVCLTYICCHLGFPYISILYFQVLDEIGIDIAAQVRINNVFECVALRVFPFYSWIYVEEHNSRN